MVSPTEPRRVLIVDDEVSIATTLGVIFTRAGYQTRAVHSAEEALRLLEEQGWVPDVAVLDVCLPGMHGIDLAILLRAKCPACNITLFSGQPATEALLNDAEQEGHFFEILAKPVHPEELLTRAALEPHRRA
jgi:CheY-like chemotaxis protein